MRATIHLVLVIAILGSAAYLAGAKPSDFSAWTANSTTRPFCVTKFKIPGGPSGGATYFPLPVGIDVGDSGVFIGGQFCAMCPMQVPFGAFFSIPAGPGSRAGMYGGKYVVNPKTADPMVTTGLYSSLSDFLYALDVPLQNLTSAKSYKTKPPVYLGGAINILTAKLRGKVKGDDEANLCDGKFKVVFGGNMVAGPWAGLPVKGSLAITFRDALEVK